MCINLAQNGMPQFHLSTANFIYLRIQGLWTKTLCEKYVTHTYSHIFNVTLEPFTCIINMINFGNKHVKDILYVICSNHLFSEYIHYKHLNFKTAIKALGFKTQFPIVTVSPWHLLRNNILITITSTKLLWMHSNKQLIHLTYLMLTYDSSMKYFVT